MRESALVTAIGSFSADIVIKNIKKMDMCVVGCDIYPKQWLADASNVDVFYQSPLARDEEEYIDFIIRIVRQEKIAFILPLTDVEVDVLNEHRDKIEKEGVKLCLSDESVIRLCRDKMALQSILAQKSSVKTIPTYWLEDVNPEELKYPIVCKPVGGRSSEGLCYIDHLEYLQLLQKEEREKPRRRIVQPKIEGNIVTVDVIRQSRTGKCVILPRRELLRTKNGAGTTVFTFDDEKLEELSRNIATVLDINGCVNFEFIEAGEGDYFFLECNPRFSGGVEFACISGYDCVKNHINCFRDFDIEDKGTYISQYIARKYEEFVTCTVSERENSK